MASSSLSEALHRLMHAYKWRLRANIRRHQITLPITHIRVLKGVGRLPDCTARVIVQRMGQDKSRVTRVLNDLVKEGLVERSDNPEDRRSQLLAPTDAGVEMLEKVSVLEGEAAACLTEGLDADELDTFLRIAATMTTNAMGHTTEPHRSHKHG
ncbi:MarR family winged helix-turn-helix transcriptional regulator [Halomonas halodenitrificans]|uniref:MarR family winged helix-turn-helix transcriptional regulator n=1 Tax=Halomonas halodenitrificans TaxID=28252 RepID=UPI0005B93223|nr:MarR family winged helix-turn-helix transcriptional regulator [Halomonas halodenitrificans]